MPIFIVFSDKCYGYKQMNELSHIILLVISFFIPARNDEEAECKVKSFDAIIQLFNKECFRCMKIMNKCSIFFIFSIILLLLKQNSSTNASHYQVKRLSRLDRSIYTPVEA